MTVRDQLSIDRQLQREKRDAQTVERARNAWRKMTPKLRGELLDWIAAEKLQVAGGNATIVSLASR